MSLDFLCIAEGGTTLLDLMRRLLPKWSGEAWYRPDLSQIQVHHKDASRWYVSVSDYGTRENWVSDYDWLELTRRNPELLFAFGKPRLFGIHYNDPVGMAAVMRDLLREGGVWVEQPEDGQVVPGETYMARLERSAQT